MNDPTIPLEATSSDPRPPKPAPAGEEQRRPNPRRGRRAVLDAEKREVIYALLTVGCSRRNAAAYVGCSPATIYNLLQRDSDFAKEVLKAESKRELSPLTCLEKASKTHWRAAAWLLERRMPSRYARQPVDAMTNHAMAEIIERFVGILASTVRSRRDRDLLFKRIEKLTHHIRNSSKYDDEEVAPFLTKNGGATMD